MFIIKYDCVGFVLNDVTRLCKLFPLTSLKHQYNVKLLETVKDDHATLNCISPLFIVPVYPLLVVELY